MKSILLCVNLLFIFSFKLFAIGADSLINYHELTFSNQKESEAFSALLTKKNDGLFELLMKVDGPSDESKLKGAESKINICIEKLNKKIARKDEAGKIKMITSYVEDEFLKVYQIKSNFSELVETGLYNNLSTMSLYAIILSKLNLPFEILEANNSLSISAFPATAKIEIKSKETEKKYFNFSEYFIKKFAISLNRNPAISPEELAKESELNLFNKYYFSTSPVSYLALAALTYRSKCLYLFEDKKSDEALIEMEKAYYLNPDFGNQFTFKYQLINTLGSKNYNHSSDVHKLILLCRYHNLNDPEVTGEFIAAEHLRLINSCAATKNVSKTCEDYHAQILNSLKDERTKKEIQFKWNMSMVSVLKTNKENHDLVFSYIEKAYEAKPSDPLLHSVIIEDFNTVISQIGNAEDVLTTVDVYANKFDFVSKSTPIMRIKANCLLEMAFLKFNKGMMEAGNDYLEKSAKTYEPLNFKPTENYVERAYLEAARNYYIAGDKIKAKAYLNKGFALAPESVKIKDKLKLVN